MAAPHAAPRKQRSRHSPPAAPPLAVHHAIQDLDTLLALPPIDGPKPWTDTFERAALAHVAAASNPLVALSAYGVAKSTASVWLSDDPPPMFKSACHALAERLKVTQDWCETDLFGRIRNASADPRHWTAAAWILERSRGYIVQQPQGSGPSIVVNIGRLELTAGARRDGVPVRQLAEEAIVEASVVGESIVE